MNFKKLFGIVATIAMMSTLVPVASIQAAYSDELQGAYDYAYEIGITTQDSIDSANMMGGLIRSHMAKMMSNYATDVLGLTPDTSVECDFNDVANQSAELTDYIVEACQLGLMGRNNDGSVAASFNPNGLVNRAQFGTVLSRALYGDMYNGAEPYYADHLAALKDDGVMNNISNPMAPEVRGYVMLMMQRADEDGVATNAGCDDALTVAACAVGDASCPAACMTPEVAESNGTLNISLSSNTAAAASIADTANGVEFVTVTVKASTEDVIVSSLTFKREGLGSSTDFDKVYLASDDVIVSNSKSVSSDDVAVLTVNRTIKAGESVNFTLLASMNNQNNKINRFALTEVTANTNNINGLPVVGNSMTTFDYDVAGLSFDDKGTASTIDLGEANVTLGEFKLEDNVTASRKDLVLKSIRLKAAGGVKLEDISDLKLYADGSVVTKSVNVVGDYATFVFNSNFVIEDGKSKIFTIKGTVNEGNNADTITFSLKNKFDVYATEEGTAMGIAVTITTADLLTYTLNAGKITLSTDTTNPSSQELVKESSDVLAFVSKITADQPITVDTIRVYIHADTNIVALDINNDGDNTDTSEGVANTEAAFEGQFNNWKLVVAGRTLDTVDALTVGNAADVGDGTSYIEFDVATTLKGGDLMKVYANVLKDAETNTVLKLTMSNVGTAAGNSLALRGVEYESDGATVAQAKLVGTSTSSTVTVVGADAGASMTRNDGYGATTTFLAGEQEAKLLKFVVNAGNSSSLQIKKLNFDLTLTDAAAFYSDYTNVTLYIDGVAKGSVEDFANAVDANDGTLTIQDINYTVAKNSQAQFELRANIDTSAAPLTTTEIVVALDSSDSLFYDVNTNEVTTLADVASANFLVADNAVLTVAVDGNTPDSAIVVAGMSDVEVAKYKLTATDGDVKVSKIWLKDVSANNSDSRVSSYKLFAGADTVARASRTPSNDGEVIFDLGTTNAIVIEKGKSVVFTVKANLNTVAAATETNTTIQLELSDLKAETKATSKALTEINGGTTIDDGDHYTTSSVVALTLDSNVAYIRKTQPTVATVALGTTKLTNGEQTVYKFTVTADAAGDVEIAQIQFAETLAGVTASTYKLFVNGVDKTADFDAVDDTSFTADANKNVIVSAGSSKTFELKTTIAAAIAGDYATYKITEDAASLSAGTENKADCVADANNNFCWSDLAGAPHSDTTVDYFNGYIVNGLDTIATTLEN